jgi:hypothetical protein
MRPPAPFREIRSGPSAEQPVVNEGETMAATDVRIADDTEAARIERWRQEELERAGYSAEQAAELAASAQVDLHEAIDLVDRGCPPGVALQILL